MPPEMIGKQGTHTASWAESSHWASWESSLSLPLPLLVSFYLSFSLPVFLSFSPIFSYKKSTTKYKKKQTTSFKRTCYFGTIHVFFSEKKKPSRLHSVLRTCLIVAF